MTGFIRRFGFDPGLEVLTSIEGVVVIDRDPPPIATGTGTGTVNVVAEFENGPYDTPTEVFGPADVLSTFGGFGFAYDPGAPGSNPCARARRADGALAPEYWNGNGAIALARKTFRRLLLTRVDTSVGEVSFLRLASLVGGGSFTFDLEPGQALVFDVGGGDVTATFAAAAATLVSGAGTYPSTFAGGEWIDFAIDGTVRRATFLASDQSQADVIARLNLAAGYAAFANAGPAADDTTLTGRLRGLGGSVQIVAVSAAIVSTATGFVPGAAVAGTGDVQNVDAVTVAEADAVVNAAEPTASVERTAQGNVRIVTTEPSIVVRDTSTAAGFGFATELEASADEGADGVIPAGTRIETTVGAREFVTVRDVRVTAGSAGPYRVRVRHALDDGSGLAAAVSAIETVRYPIALGAFSVTNDLPVAAALSEAAIDAAYLRAIGKSKGVAGATREINVTVSARQSNAIRTELRSNGLDASANGCYGRVAVVSPPLGTTRADARSSTTQPGVGATRSDRVVYTFPGVQILIPEIAARGLAGGAGFTADGVIDVHFDTGLASLLSQLPPEENPGQQTTFLDWVLGLEANNPDVQDLQLADYEAFRRAGIAAPRIANGLVFVQSGVVSVDPATQPNVRNVARRRMADFIQDSLAIAVVPLVKKIKRAENKSLVISLAGGFLSSLRSKDNPDLQRIARFSLDGKSGNTPQADKQGVFRVLVKVKLLGSLDVIVFDMQIGETVEFVEAA